MRRRGLTCGPEGFPRWCMPNLVMYLPLFRSAVCTVGPQPCLLDRMNASLRFVCRRYRRPGTARAAEYKRLCIYCPTSHLLLFITLCHLFHHSNALHAIARLSYRRVGRVDSVRRGLKSRRTHPGSGALRTHVLGARRRAKVAISGGREKTMHPFLGAELGLNLRHEVVMLVDAYQTSIPATGRPGLPTHVRHPTSASHEAVAVFLSHHQGHRCCSLHQQQTKERSIRLSVSSAPWRHRGAAAVAGLKRESKHETAAAQLVKLCSWHRIARHQREATAHPCLAIGQHGRPTSTPTPRGGHLFHPRVFFAERDFAFW